jgi:hypothetical protein
MRLTANLSEDTEFYPTAFVTSFLYIFSLLLTRGLQRDVVLSLLTNSALVYESQCGGMGGGGVADSQ